MRWQSPNLILPTPKLENHLQRLIELIKRLSYHHTETSQLICRENQLTSSYMMKLRRPYKTSITKCFCKNNERLKAKFARKAPS